MSNFATLTRGASYSGRTGGAAALASARHYAFLLVPNFSMIAFANAVEVLRMANQVSGRDIFKWSVCSVDGPGVVASNGVELDAVPLDSADAVDVLFVCGGNDVQRLANADHIEAVQRKARTGIVLGGICTGSYVLAKARLLSGYKCAIHWEYWIAQAETFFDVEFTRSIFEIDRDRITCSGGVAPLEMMLHIMNVSLGASVVTKISDQFSVESVRRGDAKQQATHYGARRGMLSDALELMESNIEHPLSLVELAGRCGVSERQLLRLFATSTGHSVMEHYRSLRLRRARQLLLQSRLSLTEICVACGFQSTSHFTTAYKREFSLTPTQQRGFESCPALR